MIVKKEHQPRWQEEGGCKLEYVSGYTRVFGLIGDPVEHSLSPRMHNGAFRELNLNCIYVPFRVKEEQLPGALEGIRSLHIQGVNVTTPHKEDVLPYLDKLSEKVKVIGAVNTIKNEEGILAGYNTDGSGFVRYLKEDLGLTLEGKNITIIGIGGAAKSIAFFLSREKVEKIVIANRTPERAEEFCQVLKEESNIAAVGLPLENDILNSFINNSDLVVYTLPMDFVSDGNWPFDPASFSEDTTLVDLRYYPRETAMMQIARERGLKAYNGGGMLLYQGIEAFKIFTGVEPPVEDMRKAFQD